MRFSKGIKVKLEAFIGVAEKVECDFNFFWSLAASYLIRTYDAMKRFCRQYDKSNHPSSQICSLKIQRQNSAQLCLTF